MKTWAALLLTLSLLAGCGEPPQPVLRVGINPWVGYDPLVLARERDLLDATRVRVVELGSNSESQRALRNGQLDAAALTLDEALRLADEGLALKIVAILDVSKGADAVLASPDISDPAKLKGRRIALEETALGALVLDGLLRAGQLREQDVRVDHMEATQLEHALKTGRVDAVVTFEPIKSRLMAAGYKVIFDSRRMPGEIVDVLVVRAETSQEQIAALLSAWEQGRYALLAAPAPAAALLAPGVDLTPEHYLATLEGLDFIAPAASAHMLAGHPAPLAQQSSHLVQALLRLGLIRRSPDWGGLLGGAAAEEGRP